MDRLARAPISGSCSRNPYYSKPSHRNPPRFGLPATRIICEAQTGVITKPLHTGRFELPATRIIREAHTGLIKLYKTITENSQLPPISLSLCVRRKRSSRSRTRGEIMRVHDMDSVHLELQYNWQIRRSPVFFCSSWNLVHRRRFRQLQARLSLSRETDTDPKTALAPKNKRTKPENKRKNKKTKPTKNCSLLIDCFPAAKNHNPRKLSALVTQSVLCTKDDRARPARLDQSRAEQTSCFFTLLAASFFLKNNFHPLPNKKTKNRPSRNFFNSKTPADQLADSK